MAKKPYDYVSKNNLKEYDKQLSAKVKNLIPQVKTMPVATDTKYKDRVVQFVGTTDTNYTKGYYYENQLDGTTRKWVRINVQPAGSGSIDIDNRTLTYNSQGKLRVKCDGITIVGQDDFFSVNEGIQIREHSIKRYHLANDLESLLVLMNDTQTITHKTINANNNTITNLHTTNFAAGVIVDSLGDSAVRIVHQKALTTEFGKVAYKINIIEDTTNYIYKFQLLNANDSVVSEKTLDLPIEKIKIVSLKLEDNKLKLIWEDDKGVEHTLEIPLSSLLANVLTFDGNQTMTNKTINAEDNNISNLTLSNFKLANIDKKGGSLSNDDNHIATSGIIKEQIDKRVLQLENMPEASELSGQVVQYIGADTTTYIRGYFYRSNGSSWLAINTQDATQVQIDNKTIKEDSTTNKIFVNVDNNFFDTTNNITLKDSSITLAKLGSNVFNNNTFTGTTSISSSAVASEVVNNFVCNGLAIVPTPSGDTHATNKGYVDNNFVAKSVSSDLASSSNKLLTESEVDYKISQVEGNTLYRTTTQDSFETKAQLLSATNFYLANGDLATPTKNDVVIVLADEEHQNKTAKYEVASVSPLVWGFVVAVATTNFSDIQWFAINSGITTTKVSDYDIGLNDIAYLKTNKIQCYTIMRVPSAFILGQIAQYQGETTTTYTKGHFYECYYDTTITPAEYKWREISLGSGGSGGNVVVDDKSIKKNGETIYVNVDNTLQIDDTNGVGIKDNAITKAKINSSAKVVFEEDTQTLKNKTINATDNTITNLTLENVKSEVVIKKNATLLDSDEKIITSAKAKQELDSKISYHSGSSNNSFTLGIDAHGLYIIE